MSMTREQIAEEYRKNAEMRAQAMALKEKAEEDLRKIKARAEAKGFTWEEVMGHYEKWKKSQP